MIQQDGQSTGHFRFLDLPKEIRPEVLRHSDLVDHKFEDYRHQAVWISGAKHFLIPNRRLCDGHTRHNSCRECDPKLGSISTSLLCVNKQVHQKAV